MVVGGGLVDRRKMKVEKESRKKKEKKKKEKKKKKKKEGEEKGNLKEEGEGGNGGVGREWGKREGMGGVESKTWQSAQKELFVIHLGMDT